MSKPQKKWRNYELAAAQLIRDAGPFMKAKGVRVDQAVRGATGNNWNIEVKAYDVDDDRIIIVECKRYKRRVNKEVVGGFAYRVHDTGSRGILVTTLPLQKGGQLIVQHEQIAHIILTPDSTEDDYHATIANKVFIRHSFQEAVATHDSLNKIVTLVDS